MAGLAKFVTMQHQFHKQFCPCDGNLTTAVQSGVQESYPLNQLNSFFRIPSCLSTHKFVPMNPNAGSSLTYKFRSKHLQPIR
jgi:hypothetical protein